MIIYTKKTKDIDAYTLENENNKGRQAILSNFANTILRANETLTQGKPLFKATFADFYNSTETLLFRNLGDAKLFAKRGTFKDVKISKLQLTTNRLNLADTIAATSTKIQQLAIFLKSLTNEKILAKKSLKMIENTEKLTKTKKDIFEKDKTALKTRIKELKNEYDKHFNDNMCKLCDKLSKLQILANCYNVEEVRLHYSILDGVRCEYPRKVLKYHIDGHNAKY